MIETKTTHGVMYATIDAGPINLMTMDLTAALARTAHEADNDASVRVLVLQSANPDFFIAHFDVEAILEFKEPEPHEPHPNGFQRMCEHYRTMSTVTIAKVAGRVGGGGAEFAASCDMRFGALDKTVINQMEVPLGLIPGGSGTQRLPRLLGLGRAIEVVIGADDLDAATAERWGWLNRAMPAEDLDGFVDRLAKRIASFPPDAIAGAKESLLAAEVDPTAGLSTENAIFEQLSTSDDARAAMRGFLDGGGQTPEVEMRMGDFWQDRL